MFERIVCATDLSPTAHLATRYAVTIAEAFGSSLELVHAWNALDELNEYAVLSPAVMVDARRARVAQLAGAVEPLRARLKHVTAEVVDGGADRALIERADDVGAGLVVVGTEGRRGIAHALLGSVAERILRTSDVPVLAVPKTWNVAERFAPREILVAVDLGPASQEILRFALRLGRHVGARVVAVHAWGATLLSAVGTQAESAEAQMQGGFERWMDETMGASAADIERVVERGDPADVIERVASARPVDLVMMATAGRTGLEHFLLGSVTERTLRNAARPVLSFRRPPVEAATARSTPPVSARSPA